ncbi:MAG: UDP-N-acetylglucosamine 1-carboxyvinyltransferase [Candidatus Jacksonbacteria bacterium]|nr:UDP-N-acetylglucosamine 1-carboxyvinyltransferase [Candidatus Jacksonbacteria bacterium]
MSQLIIKGPKTLKGEFTINGFKNAATPIIAAALLIEEECILDNVPRVGDVEKMVALMKSLGCAIEWTGFHELTINAKDATPKTLDETLIKTMRSSVLFIGPLLARFKKITIPEPGGCFLGNRPLTTHFSILEQFGAKIDERRDKQGKCEFTITIKELKGADVTLPEFSVTATENAILLGALASGRTTIRLAAQEPHVADLIKFLDAAGARIREKSGNRIVIDGVGRLRGIAHAIIPDMLETGTLAVASALLGRGVILYGVDQEHLSIALLKLKEIGVKYETGRDRHKGAYLKILPSKDFTAFKIQTLPYPGFPTDLQEPFSLLATQSRGASIIHDPLFEDRMKHIPELVKMGARAIVCDPHRSIIIGPTPLHSYELKSLNIRAGGMFVIAGLLAEGETVIHNVEDTIDRGYERLDERLNALGAAIKRVDPENFRG